MIIFLKTEGYAAGRRLYPIDMGSDAPDTSKQDAIAADMQKLTQEQWEWVKGEYEKAAPDRAAAAEMARKVSQAQLDSMGLQDTATRSMLEDRENLYRPLEQKIVAEANEFDTPERREAAAGRAVADVGQQVNIAQAAQQRNQQRMGVNPNSGAALALGNTMSLGEAATKAGAANTARDNIELQGYARKMDAANLGRGIASSQATSAGVALNQGNSAVANAGVPAQVSGQGVAQMQGGANATLGGLGSAAGVYNNSSNLKAQAGDNSGMWGALGALGGAAIMAFSDEEEKTDRKTVEPEISLAAIRRLPKAESWRYREDSIAADGGKTHVGPMAQDVQLSLGDATAPGGKQIDLVSMNGHLTNAVKAIDQRVIALEHARKAA